MQASLPLTTIARTSIQTIDVGEIRVGAVSIGTLALSDVRVGMSTGVIRIRDLKLSVALDWSIDWQVGVDVDLGFTSFTVGGSGTIGLPRVDVQLPLLVDDFDLVGFSAMSAELPSLTVSGVNAVVPALHGLRLGPAVAEQIRVNGMRAPEPPLGLSGIGIGQVRASGISVPGAAADGVTIHRVAGGSLPISSLAIPGLSIPPMSVGSIQSGGGLDVNAVSNEMGYGLDVGIFKATLRLVPSARVRMSRLEIQDVSASASVGALELRDVSLPFEVFDVTLSQLGITTIQIPQMEVA